MSAVMVATFFNLLFLMLTLRVLCTRLRWRGQPHEAAQSDAERPSLPPVAPTVVLQPDNEVISLLCCSYCCSPFQIILQECINLCMRAAAVAE